MVAQKARKNGGVKKSVSKLKKELDKWFSLYIRLKYSDDNGMVICFTSGRKYHYKNIHAGHFISRRHLATRWLEQNVMPQSAADNLFGQGEQYQFALNLDREYGVTRLASIIWYLKEEGYTIHREDLQFTTRFNIKTTVAKYLYFKPTPQFEEKKVMWG